MSPDSSLRRRFSRHPGGEVRANEDFDEAKMIAVVEKEASKFMESADAFAKAGRSEKAAELQTCAVLLTGLLPAKLDEDAYPQIVSDAIASRRSLPA